MVTRKKYPKWNFNAVMFWFMRLSGISLVLLGAVGFVGAWLLGARLQLDFGTLLRWTFFPNPNHVISSVDVQSGWQTPFWDIMQLLIVIFGIVHGVNGLRVVLEDYLKGARLKVFLRVSLLILGLGLFVIAIFVIRAG